MRERIGPFFGPILRAFELGTLISGADAAHGGGEVIGTVRCSYKVGRMPSSARGRSIAAAHSGHGDPASWAQHAGAIAIAVGALMAWSQFRARQKAQKTKALSGNAVRSTAKGARERNAQGRSFDSRRAVRKARRDQVGPRAGENSNDLGRILPVGCKASRAGDPAPVRSRR